MHANDNRSYAHCCRFDQVASFDIWAFDMRIMFPKYIFYTSIFVNSRRGEGGGLDYKHSRPQILLLTMGTLRSQLGPVF